jgi:hypothetical protein
MSKRKRRRSSRPLRTTKQGTFWARKKGNRGQRIELYSAAYKLALARIPPDRIREQPDISLRVHASIRRQLKAGETDAHTVAFTALKDVLAPDTP